MAKMKVDLQQVKQMLLERGERVGLGVAVAIMALFLFLGVLGALRSSSPDKEILQAAQALKTRIQPGGITKEEIDKVKAPEPPEWYALLDPDRFEGGSLFQASQANDTKRHNPFILPVGRIVKDKLVDVQMDTIRGDFLTYQMFPETKKVAVFTSEAGAEPGVAPKPVGFGNTFAKDDDSLVHLVQARRVVLVSSVFPLAQQIELFRKALRLESVNELFGPKESLAPKFLGLNVLRTEVQPDGKFAAWQPLYTADANGRAILSDKAPATKKLLQEAVYDESQAEQLAKFIVPGLVTPVPRLAYGSLPVLKLSDLSTKDQVAQAGPDFKGPGGMPYGTKGSGPFVGKGGPTGMPGVGTMPGVGPKGGMPGVKGPGGMPGQGAAAARSTGLREYTELPAPERKMFRRRFKDTLVVFSPTGLPGGSGKASGGFPFMGTLNLKPGDNTKPKRESKEDDEEEPGPATGPEMKEPGPGMPTGAHTADVALPDKILVRFLDADVEPGKTYVYAVQVRVHNPNHGRPDVTAFKALAEVKELLSPWTVTPSVTTPHEWDYYAVDQFVLDPEEKKHPAKGADTRIKDNREYVAVQLHKWVEKFFDPNSTTGYPELGDWAVLERLLLRRGEPVARPKVEVELPEWVANKGAFELVGSGRTTKSKKGGSGAITVDFVPPSGEADLVADFTGGTHIDYPIAGRSYVRDDSAVELLLLGPDGKLRLRSGRADADTDSPRGQERARNFSEWQGRLDRLKGYGQRPGQGKR